MPKLGETMEEGYLVAWKKEVGDKVEKGEVLFEVMSDKTNFEVESLHEGYLRRKLHEPSDEPIPVITAIGYISDAPDEPVPETLEKPSGEQPPEHKPAAAIAPEETKTEIRQPDGSKRIKASPLAKKIAEESGIDISLLKGTGPEGRIEKKDVLDYVEKNKTSHSPSPEPVPLKGEKGGDTGYTVQEWTPLRRIIAKRLSESKREIPHYYFQGKFIADEIIKLKNEKKILGTDLTYTDFLLFTAAKAIREYPLINAAMVSGEVRIYPAVDIGLAVSVEHGLVVPVLRDCDNRDIVNISINRKELIEKARTNSLSEAELKNARFVISNLGMYGVENFQPIISPPGTAIMGVGKLGKEIVIVGDKPEIKSVMNVSFSFDHRIIDGSYAGLFYKKFKELFENPGILAI